MNTRKIIKIDEEKCTGCGLCIPNCPEGALQLIDGKARLISDLFCDGLGACIGHCPEGAIHIEEREAEKYNEPKVMENIIKAGPNTIKAHLEHLKDHGEMGYFKEAVQVLSEKGIENPLFEANHPQGHGGHHGGGCPGSRMINRLKQGPDLSRKAVTGQSSELRQWPVQIRLVPTHAPYFSGADLLVAADCVPFAYPDFHADLLKDKTLLVGCPKLDDLDGYREKLSEIIKDNDIRSVTYAHMEVPCCFGLISVLEDAITASGKDIPFHDITITLAGEKRA